MKQMRTRIFSVLLSLAMLLSLLPATALAADKTVSTFADLQSAVQSAESGDVITVSGTITLTGDLEIPAASVITLKGADSSAKLETSGKNTILVKGNLTIQNLWVGGQMDVGYAPITVAANGAELHTDGVTVENTCTTGTDGFTKSAHGIQLATEKGVYASGVSNAVVELKNSTIQVNAASARGIAAAGVGENAVIPTHNQIILDNSKIFNGENALNEWKGGYSRGMDLVNATDTDVTIRNGSQIAGFQYAINSPRNTETSGLSVTVQNSDIRGWATFNVWSDGGTFLIQGSTLTGMNGSYNGDKKYSFSTFVINRDIYNNGWGEAENNKIILEDSTVAALTLDGQPTETLLRVDTDSSTVEFRGTVTFTDNTNGGAGAVFDIGNMDDPTAFMERHANLTDGVTVNTPNGNPLWPVYEVKNTYGDGEVSYGESFKTFIGGVDYADAAKNHETVILLRNVNEPEFAVNSEPGHGNQYGGWTLDLAGHTLTLAQWDADKVTVVDSSADQTGDIIVNGKSMIVARSGQTCYTSLSAAIDAAQPGDTVKLLQDVSVNEAIVIDKDITLDLNNFTLTNAFVATQGGVDCFSLRTEANVTIQNGTYASTGVAAGNVETRGICQSSGNLTLDSVTATCNGLNVCNYAENSTLTIRNSAISGEYAVSTFNNKITVNITDSKLDGTVCGLYHNGSYHGLNLSVTGTTIRGGVSNGTSAGADDNTGVYISGSTYTTEANGGKDQQASFTNCTISGSTGIEVKYTDLKLENCTVSTTSTGEPTYSQFNNGSTTSGFSVVATDNSMKPNDPAPGGSVVINGGYYKGMVGLSGLIKDESEYPNFRETDYTIHSGYFTTDPSIYVADDKAAVTSDNGDYAFMVADKTDDVLAVPATGDPVVDTSSLPSDMSAADKKAVTDAAATVTDRGELAAAANVAVGNVTEAEKDAAVKAYEDSGLAGDNITIYAQTYLDITPTGYNQADGKLALEIKPMYRVVASTATSADQIDLEGTDKNAVVLDNSEKELSGVKNMTISITLPDNFPTENLYVKHTKDGQFVAYHKASVNADTNVLTFTNDKGFSTFEIAADSRTATVTFGSETLTLTPADIGKDLPTSTAPSGQIFGGWTFKDVEGATGTYTTLTDDLLTALNGKTVTATAYYYTPSSGTTYAVTVEKAENGKVSVSSSRAAKGSTVTVTVKPDEGYALSKLTVTDGSGKAVATTKVSDTKYTFKMPASKVTVKAVFEKADVVSTLPFTDVSGNAWYYEAVKYVYEAGMMNGTSETKFSPDNNLTRGMIVTILYRQAGSPEVESDKATWWSDARVWAMENGVSDGTNMDKPITREQLATMLYRYAGNPTTKGSLENFADASSVSSYAETAMKWAVENGIITGVTDTTLKPQGTATRAQAAAMLMRFVETIQ